MPEKKSQNESEPDEESAIGWDHPLCKAGFIPGHLLREAFGYSPNRWSTWVNQHSHLVKTMNRQPWFNMDVFIAWTAEQETADEDLPTENPKPTRAKKAQRGHN